MKTVFPLFLLLLLSIGLKAQSYSKKYNPTENLIVWPADLDPLVSDFYVHNEIDIQASPQRVWQLLIAATAWNSWYDGIQQIKFEDSSQVDLAKNTKVFWRSMGQDLNNTVVEFEPATRLAWQFREQKIQGHHAWVIVPTATGCRVITDESQTGRLAKLQKIFLPKKLMKQHDRWLRLLKAEAEKG